MYIYNHRCIRFQRFSKPPLVKSGRSTTYWGTQKNRCLRSLMRYKVLAVAKLRTLGPEKRAHFSRETLWVCG